MVKKVDKQDFNPDNPEKNLSLETKILENFVSLQKVMTNTAIKLDTLNENLVKLLALFEGAAKNILEKNPALDTPDKEFLGKLDSLLEQNKTISKAIMLMEERIRNRNPFIQQNQGINPQNRPVDPRYSPRPYSI